MPVEECGNMLILAAALVQAEKETSFAERNWDLLSSWAAYLLQKGFDPEKQLCTDDFAGRLAHNTNLSIKAILALGCFAQLCQRTGRLEDAELYRRAAESMVQQWMAAADDGDHYRLTFSDPGTWSLKYNLFWDKALQLRLFPEKVVLTESEFYKGRQNRFGLPLDNRRTYGKSDWISWWAALSENREEFLCFFKPLYEWSQKTSSRVPLPDWYWTDSGRQVTYYAWRYGKRFGFQARSVVGGFFAKLYMDSQLKTTTEADPRNGTQLPPEHQ
jgi:hypothetical protein